MRVWPEKEPQKQVAICEGDRMMLGVSQGRWCHCCSLIATPVTSETLARNCLETWNQCFEVFTIQSYQNKGIDDLECAHISVVSFFGWKFRCNMGSYLSFENTWLIRSILARFSKHMSGLKSSNQGRGRVALNGVLGKLRPAVFLVQGLHQLPSRNSQQNGDVKDDGVYTYIVALCCINVLVCSLFRDVWRRVQINYDVFNEFWQDPTGHNFNVTWCLHDHSVYVQPWYICSFHVGASVLHCVGWACQSFDWEITSTETPLAAVSDSSCKKGV